LDRILSEIGKVVRHDSASIVLLEGDMARTVRVRTEINQLPMDHEKTTQVPISQLPNYQHIAKARQPFMVLPEYPCDPQDIVVSRGENQAKRA